MKKEQKRNLLLASVTALLLLIIYIMMPSGAVGKPEEGITVYSMDADTVTGLSFESSGGRIDLVRTDKGWVYEEDKTFPLNQNFVVPCWIKQRSSPPGGLWQREADILANMGWTGLPMKSR